MEIAFRTKAMRTACLNAEAIDRQYGAIYGSRLRTGLSDIRAAACLSDIPLVKVDYDASPSSLEAKIDFGDGLRLFVRANHTKPPKMRDGTIDWPKVEQLLILRIENDSV